MRDKISKGKNRILFIFTLTMTVTSLLMVFLLNGVNRERICLRIVEYNGDYHIINKVYNGGEFIIFKNHPEAMDYCEKIIRPSKKDLL